MTTYIFFFVGLLGGTFIGYVLGKTQAEAQISEEERPWKVAYEALKVSNDELDEENDRLRKLLLEDKKTSK